MTPPGAHNRGMVILDRSTNGKGATSNPTRNSFQMYEAVRRVFATGDPASWPVNTPRPMWRSVPTNSARCA